MFSVILPVWNRAASLPSSIESVLAQTYTDFELLIIDDGSDDGVARVVKPYLSEKVCLHERPHEGVGAARNWGIGHARGDYIAYLDSDNTWHPEYLARMREALVGGEFQRHAAYCIFNLFRRDSRSGAVRMAGIRSGPFQFSRLLKRNYIDINSFVHSTRCLQAAGRWDARLRRLVDWDFIIRVAATTEPVFVPEALVDYYSRVAPHTITETEDWKPPDRVIRGRQRQYQRPIQITHDTVNYRWKRVSDRKRYNWVQMNQRFVDSESGAASAYPYILQIEPTSFCNLGCPLCPAGNGTLGRERRHLALPAFRSLIDDMSEFLMLAILWDWGEPFLSPELPQMIRYCAERDIRTVTSTNAQFLQDEAYLEAILSSGLSTLIIAIDSVDQESYEKYRRRGRLDRAVAGLRHVVQIKKRIGSRTLINLRMVLMRQNENQIDRMRELARESGVDRFTVKTLNPAHGPNGDEEMVPLNPAYRRYAYQEGTHTRIRLHEAKCMYVWRICNIHANGDVVPCCYDFDGSMKVGNIHEKPLTQIWNGPEHRALRRKIHSSHPELPKCRDCTMNFALARKDWFVEATELNVSLPTRLRSAVRGAVRALAPPALRAFVHR